MLARNGVVLHLGRAGIAAGSRGQQRREAGDLVGMVFHHPHRVMPSADRHVHREFHPIESAIRPGRILTRHRVLEPSPLQIEGGLEMRFAQQRGFVAGLLMKIRRDARRIGRQRNAVGDDAMRAHVLAGDHRRARRHADDILIVRAPIVDSAAREPVGDRRLRDLTAVASERVVALLIGSDKKNVPSHLFVSLRILFCQQRADSRRHHTARFGFRQPLMSPHLLPRDPRRNNVERRDRRTLFIGGELR